MRLQEHSNHCVQDYGGLKRVRENRKGISLIVLWNRTTNTREWRPQEDSKRIQGLHVWSTFFSLFLFLLSIHYISPAVAVKEEITSEWVRVWRMNLTRTSGDDCKITLLLKESGPPEKTSDGLLNIIFPQRSFSLLEWLTFTLKRTIMIPILSVFISWCSLGVWSTPSQLLALLFNYFFRLWLTETRCRDGWMDN